MKPARIFPLLLIALALIAPRMASAQHADTMKITVDCGQSPGWDIEYVNWDPQFIDEIKLVIPSNDSVTFAGTTELNNAIDKWDDTINYNYGDDTAVFLAGQGVGIGTGSTENGFYFLLGDTGGTPFTRFDQPVTIEWFAMIAPNQVITSGYITLLPTSFQGICVFDTVTASASVPVCDPLFNFHVFDRNGDQSSISQMKFETQGLTAGTIRPSEIQAPSGWSVDTVTEFSVHFSTSTNPIPYEGNLNGFVVPLRANPLATAFTFAWTAYDQYGDLIDRDTVKSIPATVPQCSEDPNPDIVNILNVNECDFQFDEANYHNGLGDDTVSPLKSYTFTIATPGVTWDPSSIILPPQAANGTWEYSVSGNRLNFRVVHKFQNNPLIGQPAGTIWTPGDAIINPSFTPNVIVQWSDSIGSTQTSSGADTINCNHTTPDTYKVTPGSDCSYTLTIKNAQTQPEKSINEIAITMPVGSGTFPTGATCYTASNGWVASAPGNNTLLFRDTNKTGTSGYLTYGNTATFSFCIDPSQPESTWVLSWTPIDSLGGNIVFPFSDSTVPGCSPPLVCDSIRHGVNENDCSDTITVLNLREGGAEVDSVIIAPSPGWNIVKVDTPQFWQAKIESDGSVNFTTTSHAITPGLSLPFHVWYNNPDPNSFTVQVSTYARGSVCSKTATLECPLSGVSPTSVPQTLAVSVVPNPMNDEADIMLTTGAYDRVQMTLMDVLGRTSKTVMNDAIAAGDHDYTLDVSQLPPGTYYLRIVASGSTLTKKLVIQH